MGVISAACKQAASVVNLWITKINSTYKKKNTVTLNLYKFVVFLQKPTFTYSISIMKIGISDQKMLTWLPVE